MGLEVATRIDQLNPNNPVGGVDEYSTADDHLKLIKSALQGTFPNFTSVVTASSAELNFVDGVTSNIQTQLDAREVLSAKNAANGYAGLNASAQLADARVSQTNVTQHQAALAIAESQITDGSLLARVGATETISGAWNFSTVPTVSSISVRNATLFNVGSLIDGVVQQSNVTQHQAALAIAESQITDGSLLARVASTETISALWTYSTRPRHSSAGGYLSHLNASNTSGVVEISTTVPGAVFGNPGDIRLVYA